jgi:hypothetical protein
MRCRRPFRLSGIQPSARGQFKAGHRLATRRSLGLCLHCRRVAAIAQQSAGIVTPLARLGDF